MKALVVAGRELRSLFLSPLAWSILAVVQFILAYMFLSHVDTFLVYQPQLAVSEGAPGLTEVVGAQLGNAGVVLLLVTPLLTMRLVSEELRNQTLSLLFSAPLSMTEIILGKYLGIIGFYLTVVVLVGIMPLTLLIGGSLDLGMLAAGLLGLTLLLASFAALGLFMSTLTAQPTVAAISTFGVTLLLWVIDWAGDSGRAASGLFAYLSLPRHYEPMLRGAFDSADLAYFPLFIVTFLVLSIRRLDSYRLQH